MARAPSLTDRRAPAYGARSRLRVLAEERPTFDAVGPVSPPDRVAQYHGEDPADVAATFLTDSGNLVARGRAVNFRRKIVLIQRAPDGSKQANRAKAVIVRQTDQLTRLVDDLLDVTRIASGKLTMHPKQADLADIVDAGHLPKTPRVPHP